jgi:hypothetical protein
MSDELMKPEVLKPRLAKRWSMTIARETTYRVSKAQSLRMRAFDKKVEAAEAKATSRGVPALYSDGAGRAHPLKLRNVTE